MRARSKKFHLPSVTPWQVFKRSSLICAVLAVVVFGLSLRKIEPLPISNSPLQFSSTQAYRYDEQLSKQFPYRVTWSQPRKDAALWLKSQLKGFGYEPEGMRFSEVIAGRQYSDLENVFAEKRGAKYPDQIVVVSAHYDVVDTTIEGAMDDGSGVGVVLELARVFAKEKPDRTIIFLLTDSEEYGAFWGARAFARGYDRADKIIADINVDFVAPEVQTKVLTLCDGLRDGYTPLWLREMALNSLRSLGTTQVLDFSGFMEHIERALEIPPADHGPFLAENIPAFNWVGQTDHFAYEMAHFHHTKFDVIESMQPESFAPFGQGAERLIRSIDALSRIPEGFRDHSYWKITRRLYLAGYVVTILHILAFIPFLAYCIVRFGSVFRNHSRKRVMIVLRNEAKNMGLLFGSLLLGYAVTLLLPWLRVITQYEAFPATQKSELLYNPNFLAMFLVVGSVLAVYWIFRKTFAEPEDAHGYIDVRHALHSAFLALIIFLAFLKNSYLAVLLLLPPAYLWTAVHSQRGTKHRVLNVLLLAGGAITFVIMLLVLTTIFHVGVAYWYLFLAAAYGLISAYSVVLFFMALTVLIRIFRAFVL